MSTASLHTEHTESTTDAWGQLRETWLRVTDLQTDLPTPVRYAELHSALFNYSRTNTEPRRTLENELDLKKYNMAIAAMAIAAKFEHIGHKNLKTKDQKALDTAQLFCSFAFSLDHLAKETTKRDTDFLVTTARPLIPVDAETLMRRTSGEECILFRKSLRLYKAREMMTKADYEDLDKGGKIRPYKTGAVLGMNLAANLAEITKRSKIVESMTFAFQRVAKDGARS